MVNYITRTISQPFDDCYYEEDVYLVNDLTEGF